MTEAVQFLLQQGVLGVMLVVSLAFNWFLVRVVVNALKENTVALIALKTIIEVK